ncbi:MULTISPECIES: TRAP transporter small permease subunit [Spirulina sp. CCY15215]|uniref:TRAP transporter small permease subunit n=1 Tax=Spirulina sp. CCY15215 TaxID=2767591 RepID=UPI00194FC44D|nr:TRAP transporter small permease subunit [Spirulina major]
MQQFLRISRAIDRLNTWIGQLTYGLVLIMVIVGVWNVIATNLGRFFGQSLTSNAFLEIQWYLFAIIFLLGAPYTLLQNGHVRVDIFYKDWSRKRKAWVNFLGALLLLLPFSLLGIYFSYGTVINSWKILEMSPDPSGLPRYPIKSMIIVCFILLILQGISEAIKNWAIIQERDRITRE